MILDIFEFIIFLIILIKIAWIISRYNTSSKENWNAFWRKLV
jgi:hypothetical protein